MGRAASAAATPFSHGGNSSSGAYKRVETSGGIRASLAGRYASALFDLARDQRQIDSVSRSLDALNQAMLDSRDFAELVDSPVVSREEAGQALAALAPQLGLDPITTNFVGVLAKNGRKNQLRQIIRAFRRLAADHRGEITAEVTSARPLDDDQLAAIRQNLRARMGRDIAVETNVDPAILGGLVVKIGSQMIDGSIRTKLNNLAHAMKG